ncbi:hypothetical protein SAMN05444671_1076 [Flavobacterium sp. CF108]|uniref:hypothetical protein n=1 Tax=unclassified Flavobacterium TaxID=196869 RepID=UPI0008BA5EE5|nr:MULTISPECIES: hypothetical protein [unclassified Flavobacterium]SEP34337.1 hypothetical protein SAMN04487978_0650 [Flavobacterium sp. fv08]SHG65029.1 hypothetical protein SAMN05444671_1076 [Flavobacterium sp. CF108]
MKNFLLVYLFISFSNIVCGQKLVSGEYDSGMNLSYDESSKMLTGYFESYTGLDEETNNPKFSCIFYIEGKVTGKKFSVKTYYPEDKNDDVILGTIEIINNKTIKIKLPEEHGGCWNVQHFADKPEQFELEKKNNWIQVRYVNKSKSFFFKENSNLSKTKMYLIKNDIVYVEKIENGKAHCSYKGKKIIKGWINIDDLNKL